mmetsp:Transcript_55022/g.128705  ORF Transcript_55022/g.128705 Transcript_55022/m.128705 type:complete len:291 (+) Transcript_55022:602-1474(+)
MFQLLQNEHAAATCNHKTIAVLVEGSRGLGWCVVALCGECTHAIEHGCELPALILACPHNCHVCLVQQDLLRANTNAVRTRGASRRDAKRWALQLEIRREHGRDCGSHGPGHTVGTDLVGPTLGLCLDCCYCLSNIFNGGTTLSQDAGAAGIVLILLFFQPSMLECVLQRNIGILCIRTHKSHRFPWNRRLEVSLCQGRFATDLTSDSEFLILLREGDPGLGLLQGRRDLLERVAQTASNAHACDNHSPLTHRRSSFPRSFVRAARQALGCIEREHRCASACCSRSDRTA